MNKELNNKEKKDIIKKDSSEKISSQSKRSGRVPLHKQKKARIKKDPRFFYYCPSDNLEGFLKAGFEFIDAKTNEGVIDSQAISQQGKLASRHVGGGKIGYYMRIPIEQYNEDQLEKRKKNDAILKEIGILKDVPLERQSCKVSIGEELIYSK